MFYGLFERRTAALIRKWLAPGDIMLDVGANVGYFSALAADRIGSEGQVHAFEPEPRHFERLQRLVEINPGLCVFAVQAAVGDDDGRTVLFTSQHAGWHSIIPGFNREAGYGGEVIVPMVCLDSYTDTVDGLAGRRIRFVKIDAEGAESLVVRGAERLLRRKLIEALLIEMTPPSEVHSCESLEPMIALLASAGYQPFGTTPMKLLELQEQTMVLWTLDN